MPLIQKLRGVKLKKTILTTIIIILIISSGIGSISAENINEPE